MYIVFDIGGTHLRAAASSDLKTLENFTKVHSEKSFEGGISQINEIVDQLSVGQKLDAVVIAIAGTLNADKSILLGARNLPDWDEKPLKQKLETVLNTKVYLVNDAALAGLGEANFGAGKDYKIIAYLTIGTGVGGARIVDGKTDKNTYGFEPGHMIIDQGKSLEDFVSGTAIKRLYGLAPEDLKDHLAWEEVTKHLAEGINNLIVEWSPEVVILGGSVAKGVDLKSLKDQLNKVYTLTTQVPPIIKSELEDQAGLYGGLEYLKVNLQAGVGDVS